MKFNTDQECIDCGDWVVEQGGITYITDNPNIFLNKCYVRLPADSMLLFKLMFGYCCVGLHNEEI